MDLECEPMPDNVAITPELRNSSREPSPQWGTWSGWSKCDTDCGYGLRVRKRQCLKGR